MMKKVKGIAYSDIKAELLADSEIHALYMAEKKTDKLEKNAAKVR